MNKGMGGKHYGMLRALICIGYTSNGRYRDQIWKCKCECGRTCCAFASDLKKGAFKHPHEFLNCGCVKSKVGAKS